MVTIVERECQLEGEGPAAFTIANVQYWSKHGKCLKQTQRHKALQFLEYDCLHYVGDDPEFESKYTFVCLPLNNENSCEVEAENGYTKILVKKSFPVNYNNSIYKIYKNENGIFECNCQGWQTKAKRGEVGEDGCHCSHVLSLFYAFKIKKFNGGRL
jgi:hypothetical protein